MIRSTDDGAGAQEQSLQIPCTNICMPDILNPAGSFR
jgi:hypothetical protein